MFNIYVDGFSQLLNNVKCDCSINEVSINHLIYADDTVLIAPSARGLQQLILLCEQYANKTDIMFNVKKSVYMCIMPKSKFISNVPRVYLNGRKIDLVDKYKYLGMIICDVNKDDEAIASQIRGLYSRGNVIIKNFSNCTEEVKCLLFKAFCCNFYCCHLWSNCTKESRRRLKVAHNRVFRNLMKLRGRTSMSQSFMKYNVSHSDVIIRKSILGFMKRITSSNNDLVCTLVNSNHYFNSSLFKYWAFNLFSK